jgi:Methyltransferase domain
MKTDAKAEIEDLRRALTVGSQWVDQPSTGDLRFDDQLLRDNAVRLHEALRLADPFLTGANPRVLECGAGPLYTIDALRWRYDGRVRLYATEHPAAVRPNLAGELEKRGVEFAAHDLLTDQLPWREVKFDLVVLAEVIEHIPPTELPEMLRRLSEAVAEEGALLMSSPNSQALWNVLSLAIGNGQMLDAAFPPEKGSYGHIRMYARKEVEELLAYAGLELRDWTLSNWAHAYPWPGAPVRDRLRLGIQRTVPRLIPRWASGWICTATLAR